jgi:hypothetical protein
MPLNPQVFQPGLPKNEAVVLTSRMPSSLFSCYLLDSSASFSVYANKVLFILLFTYFSQHKNLQNYNNDLYIYTEVVYLMHNMFRHLMGHHQVLFRVKCCTYNQYGSIF